MHPTIDVSASVGISNVLKKLEVLDAGEYRQALKRLIMYSSVILAEMWMPLMPLAVQALTQNYNVAVGGGTETGRYRLSAWLS